jgi:hypothetical protein
VIEIAFIECKPFSGGLAAVEISTMIDGKRELRWGYIDKNGNRRVPALFTLAGPFQGGIANVRDEKERYYIDVGGSRIDAIKFRNGNR